MIEISDNTVKTPTISVILATKGDKLEFLKNCVNSLMKQNFKDFEIILISKKFPEKLGPLLKKAQIRFIEEEGCTLGAARNLGVKNARGTMVSFIDDDAEASPEWLDNISLTFSNFPTLACLGGPHFTPKDESEKNPLRLVEGLFGEAYLQKIQFDKAAIGKIAGCNVTYKKSIFETIGYLNESLRTCEDWEFNRRLLENGYSLLFDPKIWVFHHRQGLKHVFQGSTKSAPFYLSWKTFKLASSDSLIASFYITNFAFILLLIFMFLSPLSFIVIFLSFLGGYVVFTAVRTHTYNRKLLYFPLVLLISMARIAGFYFGLVKVLSSKITTLFSR